VAKKMIMKLIKSLLFSLFILFVSFSCIKSPTEVSDEGEAIIRDARNRSNQAIQEKDTVSLASIWTTDYHLITSRNFEASGRDANRSRFANEFKTRPDVIYIRTPSTIEVFPAWNMAAENGTWTGRWTDQNSIIEVKGSYYAKWHNVKGEWLIRSEVFTPLSCEGGKFCDEKPF
jgi:Domain of unknown function (DUF4440)